MSALERLLVKLAVIRHVRDVSYWKLPEGTVIVAHPKVSDLASAGAGSKVKVAAGRDSTLTFQKTPTGNWSSGVGPPLTNQQLSQRIGGAKAELAIKGGKAQTGAFGGPTRSAFGGRQQIGGEGSLSPTAWKKKQEERSAAFGEQLDRSAKAAGIRNLPGRPGEAKPTPIVPGRPGETPKIRQLSRVVDRRDLGQVEAHAKEASRVAESGDTYHAHKAAQAAHESAAIMQAVRGNESAAQHHRVLARDHDLRATAADRREFGEPDWLPPVEKKAGPKPRTDADEVTSGRPGLKGYGSESWRKQMKESAAKREAERQQKRAEVKAKIAEADKALTEHGKKKGAISNAEHQTQASAIEVKIKQAKADGLETDRMYKHGDVYDDERAAQHKEIIRDLLDKQTKTAKKDKLMIIAGGLGGAGKSTVLKKHLGVDTNDYVTINPDDVKEEMAKRGMVPKVAGLSPMEGSALVHEESGDIANAMLREAEQQGYNIIQDITMSSTQTIDRRLKEAAEHGYTKTHALFVDIPVETSVTRAMGRHKNGDERFRNGEGQGGRYVPPDIIRKSASRQHGSINRGSFESQKHRFSGWQLWDNSVDGRDPVKIGGGGEWHVGSGGK
jgi:predicted ABC-type ATPase